MSKKTYMIIDLILLTVIGCIAEAISMYAIKTTNSPIIISFQLLVILLALYRWNAIGIVVAIPIGLVTSIVLGIYNGYSIGTFLTYSFGNIGAVLGLLSFKIFAKKNIKKGFEFILIYCIIGYIGQVFLRFIFTLPFESDFLKSLTALALYGNILSLIIVIIILTIINHIDGVLVEPIKYLKEQYDDQQKMKILESKTFNVENLVKTNNNDKDVDKDE